MENRMLEDVINLIPGGVFVYSAEEDEEFSFVSRHMLDMLGYTLEEFQEKFANRFSRMVYEEDREQTLATIWDQISRGNYDTCRYRIEKKDGTLLWVHERSHCKTCRPGNNDQEDRSSGEKVRNLKWEITAELLMRKEDQCRRRARWSEQTGNVFSVHSKMNLRIWTWCAPPGRHMCYRRCLSCGCGFSVSLGNVQRRGADVRTDGRMDRSPGVRPAADTGS